MREAKRRGEAQGSTLRVRTGICTRRGGVDFNVTRGLLGRCWESSPLHMACGGQTSTVLVDYKSRWQGDLKTRQAAI
jgi:hypothetical protein